MRHFEAVEETVTTLQLHVIMRGRPEPSGAASLPVTKYWAACSQSFYLGLLEQIVTTKSPFSVSVEGLVN